MAGEDQILGPDLAAVRGQNAALSLEGAGILVDFEPLRERGEEFQRVELGLVLKAKRALYLKGQGALLCELRPDARPPGGQQLLAQGRRVAASV